ncbi:MAG: LacI family DNA-binding transcriptional regulator [Oscillospiraceae bacterium]|nr:LacI family DNA-binding transcriptional regulator [Oscillospiraceae bacterium]MCL2280039.1 LacI family DNA-binding transcriptional regulator [Oscillospiraceae bacterium]
MNKPSMQDIADSLSISRISVWKALTNRAGVSDKLRERVVEAAIKIGYIGKPDIRASGEKSSHTIAAVVSRPESSTFWTQIIHRIAKELSLQGVNLMYTYMPARYKDGDVLPAALTDGSVSGIIVLNIYSDTQLRMLAKLPLPKVFLDSVPSLTPSQMNGDIIFIEGRASLRDITGKLLDGGRTRLGFVGDIQYAQTNMDRYLGFTDAFSQRGLKIDTAFCMTERLHLDTHYEQIEKFMSSLKSMPDGFVCTSDYIAHFIERYFTENKKDRSNICLTGFDNSSEYANVAGKITTVDVKTDSMGERLANKIMFAVNHPNLPSEVSYVLTEVLWRD